MARIYAMLTEKSKLPGLLEAEKTSSFAQIVLACYEQ